MKTFCKKSIALTLTLLMLITSIPVMNLAGVELGFTAEAATITSYSRGDIIQFGWYPQSKVTDSATITALNNKAPAWDNWTSYGYYTGTGSVGTMVQGDWMRYTDIMYNGNKYRGVKFTQYRPSYTHSSSFAYISNQDDNGYSTNIVYWFKFEPVDWRVLEPTTGLIMCETIIDSQPYSNTIYYNSNISDSKYAYFNDSSYKNYASDYETSSIRQWLNTDFYSTAFSYTQQNIIKLSTLNNNGYYTSVGITGYEKLDSNSTNDKIFLLSYNEVTNSNFGFSSNSVAFDEDRFAQGSDYAQSQGLYVYRSGGVNNNNSNWMLRSPGEGGSGFCGGVTMSGYSGSCIIGETAEGVRPALRFNLTSEIFQSDVKDIGNSSENGSGGSDDEPTFTEEDFKFRKAEYTEKIDYSNESPSIEITEAILLEYNTEFFDSKGYTSDDIKFTVADTDIISFNRAVLNYWSTEKVGLACLVTPLKSGTTKLTAALPDGTSASCKIISVVIEKEEDDDEEPEKDLINTNSENEAFIQQHLIFRKAYYDYFTKNLRWASEIWNHMDTAATLAAELAYDIIEGALEIVSLKFLDGLEVAANPYDVILLDFLASNISQSHFAKNAKEDALTVAVDIVNKAIKIFSDDSKWDPDFDIKNEVKLLITSSDYSQNNLYLALDNLHDGDYSDKITKIFNGFDCFGQVMKAVTAGAKFADMFVELLRYTVAIEGFYNSTAVFKSVLDEIATEMEVNNPVFASYFENALEFYEDSLTYDSIVEYVIKNKGIGDTAKLIYDMSTNVISDATVSFIMKAFKVGKDVARKVNAALWSAEVGWGLSNLLTGNNVSIGCRRMLRATYALDVATYNVMERFRTILDRDESYGAALCFDSSFNIFKMTQLYSLEQYKKYCENMATRPFTFNKSEFKNADEFLTAATVTWKNINCHYIEGTSSFNAALVDTLMVACPTDIYVYRKSDNKLVASVINNKSKLYDDSVAILCIDGEKSFAATDMDDYRIEIKATDNGTMDVIYNSYSDFKNTKKLSFDDVPIKSGNKYELDDEKESIKRDDNVEYKTDGRVDNCSCNCHKGGIAGFFFKIILFFQKIFRTNKTCSCGVNHY